jgi:hypothetical protein
MTEPEQNETPDIAVDNSAVDDSADDTEGHFRKSVADDEDTDDTEGHLRKT